MTAGVPAPLRWPRPHSPWPRVTGRSWGRPGDHRGAPGPDCEALMLTGLYRDGDQGSPLCTGRGPRAVWGHWSLPGTSCPPGWGHRPVLGQAPRPGTVPGLSRDVPGLSRDVPGCPRLSRAVPGLSQDVPGCPEIGPGPHRPLPAALLRPRPFLHSRDLIGPLTARGRKPSRRPRPSGRVRDLWRRRSAVTYGGP